MITKVGEVSERRFDFGEVPDRDRAFHSQAVGFKEDAGLLEPREEVVFVTFKFDATEVSVTKHVASNAYVRLILFIDPCGRHFKELLKFSFASWEVFQGEYDLFVIAWHMED